MLKAVYPLISNSQVLIRSSKIDYAYSNGSQNFVHDVLDLHTGMKYSIVNGQSFDEMCEDSEGSLSLSQIQDRLGIQAAVKTESIHGGAIQHTVLDYSNAVVDEGKWSAISEWINPTPAAFTKTHTPVESRTEKAKDSDVKRKYCKCSNKNKTQKPNNTDFYLKKLYEIQLAGQLYRSSENLKRRIQEASVSKGIDSSSDEHARHIEEAAMDMAHRAEDIIMAHLLELDEIDRESYGDTNE